MAEWISTFGRVLIFDTAAFARLRERRNVFAEGFLVVLIVSLLAGLPSLVTQTVQSLQGRPGVEVEVAEAKAIATFENALDQAQVFLQGFPASMREQILDQARENFRIGLDIGTRIAALPTRLPQPVAQILEHFGQWASRPFGGASIPLAVASLGAWLGYGIWVMLFAKLLGGRASLAVFFGTTAIFAVPHLLLILRWVPYLGGVLALIAFVWGLALYIKGTAIAHEITLDRAIFAVTFLPILLPGIVLWIVLAMTTLR